MRRRLVLAIFAVGLLATGLATAGVDRTWSTHLNGRQEVPSTMSKAQGQTILRLSKDGASLRYKLVLANIEDVTMAHIHMGPPGANGPVVAWLYPDGPPPLLVSGRSDGVFAEGVLTSAELVGPLAGQPLSGLVELLSKGQAYVNIHTDGFPGGEIRGNVG